MDRDEGGGAGGFGDVDLGGEVFEGVADLLDGVHFHEAAIVAGAAVGRAGDEGFVRDLFAQAVQHAAFGDDDDFVGRRFLGEFHHELGRAHLVGEIADGLRALGVGDDGGVGEFGADLFDGLRREHDVGVTASRPEAHLAAGLLGDPLAEVLVGDEQDVFVGGDLVDDFDGVAAGDDHVAERFHAGGAVDVGDDVNVGIGGFVGGKTFVGAGVGERTTGVDVGEENGARGVNDFGGLGHEVDAAEENDVGLGGLRLIGEAEGIADVIGDLLDGLDLVIVREDDGVALAFQGEDFLLDGSELRRGGAGGEDERFVVEDGHGKIEKEGGHSLTLVATGWRLSCGA